MDKRRYRRHQLILNKVIPVLNGRSYLLGGNGEISGTPFDCFGMVVEYCKLRYGLNLLEIHSDENYDFYGYKEKSEVERMILFKAYLDMFFVKILLPYKTAGDVLWCETEGLGTAGIYLGNNLMLITCPETNCDVISTTYYEIKGAYRWLLQSQ